MCNNRILVLIQQPHNSHPFILLLLLLAESYPDYISLISILRK